MHFSRFIFKYFICQKYSIHPGTPETRRDNAVPRVNAHSINSAGSPPYTNATFTPSQLILRMGSVEFGHQSGVPQSFQALRHLTQSDDVMCTNIVRRVQWALCQPIHEGTQHGLHMSIIQLLAISCSCKCETQAKTSITAVISQ